MQVEGHVWKTQGKGHFKLLQTREREREKGGGVVRDTSNTRDKNITLLKCSQASSAGPCGKSRMKRK